VTSKYGSSWTETEALLAALNQDEEECYRIVEEMTRAERGNLLDALDYVSHTMIVVQLNEPTDKKRTD
jgi:hypothetical protein